MIYGSVCSGIEAASVAWHPLGWKAAFLSEIEAFPRAVLQHHYPEVPLHGDFTTIEAGQYQPIDLLVGGTPCQDFSIAGLRAGMAGDRGNLTLQFLTLARRLRPQWVVWENVPGVLSSNGGRDFGAFLGGLGELGYGWAYRTLDAQHFGVPQRRRRVFVVGYLGDWRYSAAVLFERHSLSGHPAPRREAGQETTYPVAPSLTSSGRGVSRTGETRGQDPVIACPAISPALKARDFKGPSSDGDGDGDGAPLIAHSLRASGFDASEDGTGRGTPLTVVDTLVCNGDAHSGFRDEKGLVACGYGVKEGAHTAHALRSGASKADKHESTTCIVGAAVRRLTPRECERLQGFPNDYTLIPYRNRMAADGPRYKALGNSMAVPVMAFIGQRISLVASLKSEQVAA